MPMSAVEVGDVVSDLDCGKRDCGSFTSITHMRARALSTAMRSTSPSSQGRPLGMFFTGPRTKKLWFLGSVSTETSTARLPRPKRVNRLPQHSCDFLDRNDRGHGSR